MTSTPQAPAVPTPLPAFLAALVAFTACGDLAGPPSGWSSVSFDYTGEVEGRFETAGPPPSTSVEGVPEFGAWTVAAADESFGGTMIAGFRVTDDSLGQLLVLRLAESGEGELSCGSDGPCRGRFFVGVLDHGGLPNRPAEDRYGIVSGRVEVTARSPDRIAGSFSFTAVADDGPSPASLVVENGVFRVPLADASTAASVLCLAARAAGEDC